MRSLPGSCFALGAQEYVDASWLNAAVSEQADTVEYMTDDAAQRAVVLAAATASGVIIGAPGTGKTITLIDRVVHLLSDGLTPEQVMVLTPSRQAATLLRDRIGVRIDQATPGPLARSVASFAFQVVRGVTVHGGGEPPALLTGADQDRIIADLLAGDADDEAAGLASRWPEALSASVRASKGFRSELRAFLAECAELGVTPAELAKSDREVWRAVGSFVVEYRTVLDGMRAAHRDIPDLLTEAAALLRESSGELLGPLRELRVVLIDDAQEFTRGGLELVKALRARGVAVHAFGDPDISSGAFRGATPELFNDLAHTLGTVHVLDGPHRQAPVLTALTRTVTQAIGAAGRVEHRRAPVPAEVSETASVETFVAASPHEETDRIATVLRDWHLTHGIAWSKMAVIAHDTRQVTALESELAAREVPTLAAGVQRPLGRESVVRDIAEIVRLAMTPPEERDAEALAEALRSPFGGLDAVGLRRLRARLRHRELADGGSTPARELLRQAMMHPVHFSFVDAPEARTAERLATTLAETATAAAGGETIHELLWRVWDRARAMDGSRLATFWQSAAEQQGGAEISRALDSLVALFAAAKRFVERAPNESADVFIRDILDSEVPEDSLSSPDRPGSVTLLTPATALGTEFEVVVVAGVQDGVWPNVRLRGGLLETWRLSEAVHASRTGQPAEFAGVLDRRRSALHDELRLFVRAVSRARSRLVITAVDDDDQSPSPFFAFLPTPTPATAEDEDKTAHPMTLRGLVARHRRALTTSDDPEARAHAAGQLRLLGDADVPGARPDDWYGITPASTDAGMRDLEVAGVRVSPSRLEAFEECGVNWAVSALGGDTIVPPSAGIGTIVHEAMELVPDGDLERMREILTEHWPELDFDTAWIGRKELRRAELYLERLQSYLQAVQQDGGTVLGAEAAFQFAVDLTDEETPALRVLAEGESSAHHALISGVIDRVELYPPGAGEHAGARGQKWTAMSGTTEGDRVVVVDLKTGKYEPDTENAVLEHAQLAAYQIAVEQALVEGADPQALAGARLLLVAKTVGKSPYRIAHQHTLTDETRAAFVGRVAEAARGMASGSFTAQVESHCADTQVRVAPCRIHSVPAVSA